MQRYACAFAKESYISHMSITHLEAYQEADEAKKLLQTKVRQFAVQELLLTNVGDDGTCDEIYARSQLQDELSPHATVQP